MSSNPVDNLTAQCYSLQDLRDRWEGENEGIYPQAEDLLLMLGNSINSAKSVQGVRFVKPGSFQLLQVYHPERT